MQCWVLTVCAAAEGATLQLNHRTVQHTRRRADAHGSARLSRAPDARRSAPALRRALSPALLRPLRHRPRAGSRAGPRAGPRAGVGHAGRS